MDKLAPHLALSKQESSECLVRLELVQGTDNGIILSNPIQVMVYVFSTDSASQTTNLLDYLSVVSLTLVYTVNRDCKSFT